MWNLNSEHCILSSDIFVFIQQRRTRSPCLVVRSEVAILAIVQELRQRRLSSVGCYDTASPEPAGFADALIRHIEALRAIRQSPPQG